MNNPVLAALWSTNVGELHKETLDAGQDILKRRYCVLHISNIPLDIASFKHDRSHKYLYLYCLITSNLVINFNKLLKINKHNARIRT